MDDMEKDAEDIYLDPRNQYTPWEDDCIDQVESDTSFEDRFHIERQAAADKIWVTFQSAATAVAQFYKDRHPCEACLAKSEKSWLPFQDVANHVTLLYKDGSDALRFGFEYGCELGYRRRNKEVLSWVKKKRKHIRREELISFLSGRSPPRRRQSESRGGGNTLLPQHCISDDVRTIDNHMVGDYDTTSTSPNDHGRKRHYGSGEGTDPAGHKKGRFC